VTQERNTNQSSDQYRQYMVEMLKTLPYSSYDMILFDKIPNHEELWSYLQVTAPLLSPIGSIVVPNMRPGYTHEVSDRTSRYYMGTTWEVSIRLRTYLDLHTALIDVDG
jgi:predicted O-methyltransferase YrrM